MKKIPQLSESEWEVMRVLWDESPLQSIEVSRRLDLHPQTTRTFLSRLTKKKAVRFFKKGRGYLYEPIIDESMSKTQVSKRFLNRVFGGSLQPMLTHLVENQEISAEELKELRQVLKEKVNKA